ncbi:Ubiquitin carboxyl-terminal hydrolase 2 [Platanthera guangdongensis]|uniref:Ubiquitin carboxyl-terminal hydrolase 2 n=1 Tax=Platanthera guangdongensis TaxID=2320717 RepID=A0ABR2M8H3_9ASPA
MGKKIKKKAPYPGNVKHRAPAGSPKSVLEGSSPNIGSVTNGDRDKGACNHCAKSTIELNWILLKIRPSSMDVVACVHCRRGGKEKGKNPKRKGLGTRAADAKSNKKFMWVCLDCGQYFCGGEVSILEPYGHARRHGKQERHQCAVRADNPLISWCYSCSSSFPIQLPQEVITEDTEETINDGILNMSGNALGTLNSEKLKGYKVRGLSNLGNTCFFNSVMQNFFAMDRLRDALFCLDRPVGPLFMALRMLFIETSRSADSKGVVVNPKALFGCICAKAPQFRSYQEQDSHELLRYLLDGLQMEETNTRKTSELSKDQGKINVETSATLVDSIFGGCLSSTVSCMECGHTSVVNEPFLDLSLPVPSRKPPSKKLPSKKSNQRDKNKTRCFRETAVVQVSTMSVSPKVENDAQPSKCSESGIVVLNKTHANSSEAPEYTWMDYLGGEPPNCNNFGPHELEASVSQCSSSNHASDIEKNAHYVSELYKETDTNAQSISEFHNQTGCNAQSLSEFCTADCSNDLTVFLDTSVERSCKDEVPDSCFPVPGVILLPYTEQEHAFIGLNVNNRTSFLQDPHATNHIDNFISVSSSAYSTCKQVEDDFEGFGDLFNEPEVTSDLKEDTIVTEDMDITLWNGNISEYTLKEVDDTNAPVSIYSCLALFTKPELLSDEQAWYCEHCSKMLLQENRELRSSKLQAAKIFDQPVTVKSMVNQDEFQSNRFASNSHWDSAIEKVLDNGKSASSAENTTLVEDYFNQVVVINTSQKPITQAEGSHYNEESSSIENLHFAETAPCSSLACPFDVLDKEMLDSETSQEFSNSPAAVNSPIQDGEGTFNGINDRSSVGNDAKEPEITSHSWQSCTNAALQKSSEENSQEVTRRRKNGLMSGNAHPPKENKGEVIEMVKRDATKRILIDKIPPILTIHLKRFSQDGRGRISKLNGHVRFQETLDMRPFMDPRCIKDRTSYHLIGVVEHSGSMGGGHYVAYVRGNGSRTSTGSSSTGATWFYASDAYVREVSLAEVLQSEAYILFYEKM